MNKENIYANTITNLNNINRFLNYENFIYQKTDNIPKLSNYKMDDLVTEEEVVVDYAARVTVGVDFKNRVSVYSAALYLNGIGESEEELFDPEVNSHIVTEKAVNA